MVALSDFADCDVQHAQMVHGRAQRREMDLRLKSQSSKRNRNSRAELSVMEVAEGAKCQPDLERKTKAPARDKSRSKNQRRASVAMYEQEVTAAEHATHAAVARRRAAREARERELAEEADKKAQEAKGKLGNDDELTEEQQLNALHAEAVKANATAAVRQLLASHEEDELSEWVVV